MLVRQNLTVLDLTLKSRPDDEVPVSKGSTGENDWCSQVGRKNNNTTNVLVILFDALLTPPLGRQYKNIV